MGFLWVQWRGVARVQAAITEAWLPLADDADGLHQFQQRLGADVERLLRTEDRPLTMPAARVYAEALADGVGVARVHVSAVRAFAETSEDRALANKADALVTRIEQLHQQVAASVASLVDGNAATVATQLRSDLSALGDEVTRLRQLAAGRVTELSAEADARRTRATALAFVGSGAAALVSIFVAVAVIVALRPIQTLTEEVRRVAAGNRLRPIELGGTDEIGALAQGFDEMARALDARDRTLVDRAEELNRLSRYLASVLDGIGETLIVEEHGLVTLANPAAQRVWGASVGMPLPERLRGDGSTVGPAATQHEVRRNPFGEAGHVVVVTDVSEALKTRDRLARSERLAVVGQMLAQVTHEVRNPLNALSLNAELLAEELAALDPHRRTEAWDLLAIVSGEIDRLTRVTAHYLQLARPTGAEVAVEDLGQLLLDVARLLGPELERRSVTLTVSATALPAVMVDGARIRQAVLNIVRNAGEAGARTVSLRIEVDETEARVIADDDGPGFTPMDHDRAGEPFYTTRAHGTGLGLAISRQAVEAHGGELRLGTADNGHGARVVLALPVDR